MNVNIQSDKISRENPQKHSQPIEDFPRVLSLKQKMSYGLGDVGYNFLFDMGQLYLLKYMTDIIGLPAAAAGGVFAVAKIWDAFADVFVGTWVDNRKVSKHGKFRPLIIWSALPLALLLIANFSVPNFNLSGRLIWSYITYIVFGTIYSMGNVPYGSLATAMTKNSVERSELASWRNIGSNLGLLIANTIFMPIVLLMPTAKIGYTVTVTIFAIAGLACLFTMYHGTHENYVVIPENTGKKSLREVFRGFRAVFKNGPLLILCIANFFCFSAYNTKLAVQFYFAQYVLHNIKIVSYMSFFTIGCSIIAAIVMPSLSEKFGKKRTYILGCLIWVVSDLIGYFFTRTGLQFAIFTSISYFGNGLLTALNWALISDVVEYGEYKTYVRSEGIVYSSYTFFRKLATAAAGFIPGFVLSIVGYVPNHQQTAQALAGIRDIQFIYPVICAVITAVVFCFYPITEKKYFEIVQTLKQRHLHKQKE